MANYYTQFSAEITGVTPEERSWVQEQLGPADRTESSPPGWDGPGEDEDIAFEWEFREVPGENLNLWIFTGESGDLEQVGKFVQAFLARFRPEESFGMTYADSCSSPRLEAFSGGALIVTKDGYHIEDASGWLDRYQSRSSSEPRDREASGPV